MCGGPSQKVDCGWSQRINNHHAHVQEMGYTCCMPCVKTLIINDNIISNHSSGHQSPLWRLKQPMFPERSVQRRRLQVAWSAGWHLLHSLMIWGICHSPQLLGWVSSSPHLMDMGTLSTSCIFVLTSFVEMLISTGTLHLSTVPKHPIIPSLTTVNGFDWVAILAWSNPYRQCMGHYQEEAERHQTQQ